jgi:hypothetical protein
LSTKLKIQQDKESRMQFSMGDRVRLKDGQALYHAKPGATAEVYGVSECGGFVLVRWDRAGLAGRQDDGGYYPVRFELVTEEAEEAPEPAFDPLAAGYYEPVSTYRACQDGDGNCIVEAVRVKVIARCADEAEAKRIADALNTNRQTNINVKDHLN